MADQVQPAKTPKQLAKEAEKLAKLEKFKLKQEKAKQLAEKEKLEPKGEKPKKTKDKPTENVVKFWGLNDAYEPEKVEDCYGWWKSHGFFKPEISTKLEAVLLGDTSTLKKDKFVVVMPPPNVTGTLHLGHALTCAIQDCLTRWNRMRGLSTLWNPGCDHAGIATQVVVEKKLQRENVDRHMLGREKFIEEVWKWKKENGDEIYSQIERLGCSVDWDRAVFTLDEKMSRAVNEAFIRLYDKKLIYRAERLVNWSSQLKSAISDIEVDHEELKERKMIRVPGHADPIEFGIIETFAYRLLNDDGTLSEDRIYVATTRLETMLGDTAVAVNPDDERYVEFHGKKLKHPYSDRQLPIVCDSYVDKDFGTGAVKITPGHDPNDYELGKRHNLPLINIYTDEGKIEQGNGEFSGMMRFDARVAIRVDLKSKGLIIEEKPQSNIPMVIPRCSRSKDIIEPRLKNQWYVDCRQVAKRSADAVKEGQLKLMPEIHHATWYNWLDNIRDWCISRQLWWGHRIPAYRVISKTHPGKEEWVVAHSPEEATKKAEDIFGVTHDDLVIEQDEDVLDTWFSSGLFPFAIFGWPDDKSSDLKEFFPGNLLETGKDIIFFWVARMVMLSLELTDKLPFKEIYLHPIVRDAEGRKMSKSLGNVINPIDVIEGITLEELHKSLINSNLDPRELERATKGQKELFPNGIPKCGTDALRFKLCEYCTGSGDIHLNINQLEGDRKLCNKIWQACKFTVDRALCDDYSISRESLSIHPRTLADKSEADQTILKKLFQAVKDINDGYETYNFRKIAIACRTFWWDDLCSCYIEHIKKMKRDNLLTKSTQDTLFICVYDGLKLLHPMMPFLTEKLYRYLVGKYCLEQLESIESISLARFPRPDHFDSISFLGADLKESSIN